MIDIIKAHYLENYTIRLDFSDGSWGDYDLRFLFDHDTILIRPLRESDYFQNFFLQNGALCWKNGLELAPAMIHQRLQKAGQLHEFREAA